MASADDLISLDIIETQKENIQSLPGGRSAKALASVFSPLLGQTSSTALLSETTDVKAAIRQGFETELLSIAEADDPLDIYDRYVKWTLDAYPSAQATPQSQLLPLLERSTKAFLASPHYKNDPRYLKLWLHYIRLFSDSPKETFAFLARHSVGDGLALFYEEFAAWLEGVGRWAQAEEIFRLGLDREARPIERLARKFAEFQQRFARTAQNGTGPSSPALPTVRPALAAKVDPFATSTSTPTDPQAPTASSQAGRGPAPGSGRQKLEIFSDADAPPLTATVAEVGPAKGWESIGSIAHRKKENVVEARPWAGETLKTGKKAGAISKMMVFKDENLSSSPVPEIGRQPVRSHNLESTNSRTGRVERVFANLDAIYPGPDDAGEELCFEEIRAAHRGWLGKKWSAQGNSGTHGESVQSPQELGLDSKPVDSLGLDDRLHLNENPKPFEHRPLDLVAESDGARESRMGRPKKLKIMEIRGETMTIKTNLDSPTKPQLRRKGSAEPTMTFHTRAATDEIYDIFNQPLKTPGELVDVNASGAETEDEEDDDASIGESTASGKVDATSIVDGVDADETAASEWSEFTTKKHLPQLGFGRDGESTGDASCEPRLRANDESTGSGTNFMANSEKPLITPTSPGQGFSRPTFVPIPPEDYEPPTGSYREALQSSQNRPPFMTPIVERTESSFAASAAKESDTHSYSKTPFKATEEAGPQVPEDKWCELRSSPFREIINEAITRNKRPLHPALTKSVKQKSEATQLKKTAAAHAVDNGVHGGLKVRSIIEDEHCNPTDEVIRNTILENLQPSLVAYQGFFDRRDHNYGRGNEIRRFLKAAKSKSNDRASTGTTASPVLHFEGINRDYALKREIGRGAFAPVYLAETSCRDDEKEIDENGKAANAFHGASFARRKLEAIKMEDPPTAWEFYIMRQAKHRLRLTRAADSIIDVYELHLFADECYLVEEYRDQGTLLDLINAAKNDPSSSVAGAATSSINTGTMDEALVIFFTIELFRTVECLHANGILHGDLKADNCLVRLDPVPPETEWSPQYRPDGSDGWSHKGIGLIDFGRGIDMTSFRTDVGFIADWPVGPEDCVEMREMRPWTYQADYHGLAGIVHTMLFGKYMETARGGIEQHYRPVDKFKRYWQVELWTVVFDLLLNPISYVDESEGRMPVLNEMRNVRRRMETWLEENCEKRGGTVGGLKGALRKLEERMRGRERRR